MKRWADCIVVWAFLLGLSGCENGNRVAGKRYTFEEGAGGVFTISLYEDGTFSYYEGGLSSYRGSGSWSVKKDVLTLTNGDGTLINRFSVDGENLIFIAENSSNFHYVTLENGAVFQGAPLSPGESRPEALA